MKKKEFLTEFEKEFSSKLKDLEKNLIELKTDYSISSLKEFRKDLLKLQTYAKKFEYDEASKICEKLDNSLLIKISNFTSGGSQKELNELDAFLKNLKDVFATQNKVEEMKKEDKKEKKKRIIVVDDDEDLLKLLEYEFHEIGFDVDSFNTGKKALSFLLKPENLHDVFLLVLDRMLPDMDGLDILAQFIKESPIKIPVLILSALSSEKDVIAGLETGAIDYITKPFSVFMLMHKALNLMKTQPE